MSSEYSAYDAKACLAAILRTVRAGQSVTITYHGRPVTEVGPISAAPETFAERLRRRATRCTAAGGTETVPRGAQQVSAADEMRDILQVGYLRGADLWHLAAALYASPNPGDVTFVSLDAEQRKVAALLGFPVAPAN